MLFKKNTLLDTEGRLRSVGIIMDGNGRWAKRRGLPRLAGHAAGAARVEEVLTTLRELGVHHVTLYAFSTENWKPIRVKPSSNSHPIGTSGNVKR